MARTNSTPVAQAKNQAPARRKPAQQRKTAEVLQRLEAAPSALQPADVLQLQRSIGNRATGQLLQAKLKLGPAGDRYEQEADQVAKEVVRASRQPAVQREDVQRDEMDAEMMQAKPVAESISRVQRAFVPPPTVQREGMEEEELQASPMHGVEGGDVDTDVARSIQSAKGGGQPLHDGVRSSMEQGFGADFGGVRVHTGGQADALNRSLNARAFTTGNDIFFGKGQYNPGSSGGQELIAHELTHTVQQGAAAVQREEETLRRFPASVMNLPYQGWKGDNPNIASPGEGAKGGVFILTHGQGDVPSVVVKPLMDESPAQSEFGDKVLSAGFGINTPRSRIISAGSPEFNMLLEMVQPQAEQRRPVDLSMTEQWNNMTVEQQQENMNAVMGYVPITEARAFKLMATVQGQSLSSIASGADNQQKVERILGIVRNNALMQKIGTLAVADAVMGNDDRLSITSVKNMTNLGNYMFTGADELVAIDTTARLAQAATLEEARKVKIQGTGGGDSLMEIFAQVNGAQQLADLFFTALRAELDKAAKGPQFDPSVYFTQQLGNNEAVSKQQIVAGVQAGLNQLKAMVMGETSDARNRRARLQAAATETYGHQGRHLASWESLEANYLYKEAYEAERLQGTDVNQRSNNARRNVGDYLIEKADTTLYDPVMPVDVGAFGRNIPTEINRKATSAKKALQNSQVNPVDIEKWVGKYSPDLHVHALRVMAALMDKNTKMRFALPGIRQSFAPLPQGEIGRARTEKHERFSNELGKHTANLIGAANAVKSTLQQANEPKYNGFIGLIEQQRTRILRTVNEFSQH